MALIIQTGIHADESGAGAFLRAADENGYLAGSQLTGFMGLDHVRAETLFGMDPELYADAAGALIGAERGLIQRAFHKAEEGYCDFYGAKIRVRDREISKRRVAPGTLRNTGYHKAVWQLKVLQFDPKTLEMLISDCPVCGKGLGFVRAAGIAHCERCVAKDDWGFVEPEVDLRDFPQPVIEVEDLEALQFVTDLVDPDPEVRAAPARDVHDELANLDRGQLFDFALAVSCVIEQDPTRTATSIARPMSTSDYARLYSPDRLARAGRVILSWPHGFNDMCERAREDIDLRGVHGVRAELGQIYALSVNASVDPEIRRIAKKAIGRNMATVSNRVRRVEYQSDGARISTQAAAERFGIDARILRKLADDPAITTFTTASLTGPRLFLVEEIAAVAAMRDTIDSVSTVAVRLGLPSSAIRNLAAVGLIEEAVGPVLHTVIGVEYYHRASVDHLVDRITAKIVPRPSGPHLRLVRAMNRLGGGDKPWAELITAILEGRLAVFRVEGRFSATFIELAVAKFAEIESVLIKRGVFSSQLETVTRPDAGSILGVCVAVVCALVQQGRIEAPAYPGGPLRRQAVLDTARTYIFTSEISRRIATGPRWVRTKLAGLGVSPVFELDGNRGLAFDRPSVEAVIKELENA